MGNKICKAVQTDSVQGHYPVIIEQTLVEGGGVLMFRRIVGCECGYKQKLVVTSSVCVDCMVVQLVGIEVTDENRSAVQAVAGKGSRDSLVPSEGMRLYAFQCPHCKKLHAYLRAD